MKFGWPYRSAMHAVVGARKQLENNAIYWITREGGIVYEPEKTAVDEKIYPSEFRPEPTWLSEFPDRQDLRALLEHLRFATVISDTEAKPLLSLNEHKVLIRFMAHMIETKCLTTRKLGSTWKVSDRDVYVNIQNISDKLMVETQGEWTIGNEKRDGKYVLQHHL